MKTPADASQGKIKVRLEIWPEKQSFENRTLAVEIAEDISKHLDQTQNYKVEIPYTGEMGGGSELLVWIVPVVEFVGKPFAEAFISKVAEKVADLTGEILEKVRKGKYRKLEADVIVQSLPGSSEINVQGPLEHALDKVGADLKNIAKHLEETTPNRNLSGMMEEIEITLSIKVSRNHP